MVRKFLKAISPRRFLKANSSSHHELPQVQVEDENGRHDEQPLQATSSNVINAYSSDSADAEANSTRRTGSNPPANDTRAITNGNSSRDLLPISKPNITPAEEKSSSPPRESHEHLPIPGSSITPSISDGAGLGLDTVQTGGLPIPASQRSIPTSSGQNVASSFDGRLFSSEEVAHILEGPHLTRSKVVDAAMGPLEGPMTELNQIQSSSGTWGPSASEIQTIENGVRSWEDGVSVLIDVLDECAKIHPFVAVVVLAFKVAYELTTKKRDNDRKVLALFVEMKNMMIVLTQLKTVKDAKIILEDGSTTVSRLTDSCEQAAKDIRECLNTCDAYSRKRLIVKCLKGPIWEARLAEFVETFSTRREEFMFAMAVRNTIAIDGIGKILMEAKADAKETKETIKQVSAMLEKLVSLEQRSMQALIDKHGGATEVQKSDNALSQLIKESSHLVEKGEDTLRPSQTARDSSGPAAGQLDVRPSPPPEFSKASADESRILKEFRAELTENLDHVLTKNLEVFNRKYDTQIRQIKEVMEKVLVREGDRIIEAITTGPHDRILDPDIHKIWEVMGWKGNVKAKHFVLALRDHFFEKTQISKHEGGWNKNIGTSETQDRWALPYLNLQYLQSIHEAIDDDASGFITIEELNHFTSSRPFDWSLLKWLAYWAIGFNRGIGQQCIAIYAMQDEMFSLIPVLRRENQAAARSYLWNSWMKVVTVISSFRYYWSDGSLDNMFKAYTQSEEDRIRKNLIGVKYKIDGDDTLYLVTGPGRIEKNFIALVKVLLERHLQIFHIARTKVLNKKEWEDAWNCFEHMQRAISYRLSDLRGEWINSHELIIMKSSLSSVINLNYSLELSTWLQRFAHGIFEQFNDPSLIWSFNKLLNYRYDQSVYDTSKTYDDSNYKEILVYEEGRPDFVDTRGYELLPTTKQEPNKQVESTDLVKNVGTTENSKERTGDNIEKDPEEKLGRAVDHPLIGEWRCLIYENSSFPYPYRSMFTIDFKTAKDQPQDGGFAFTATDSLYTGEYWTLTGTCWQTEDSENKLSMTWFLKYAGEYDEQHFSGTFDTESNTISGTAGGVPDPEKHGDIVFISQQPAEVLVHRPHPTVLAEDRIPSLWEFVRGAIISQVRRKMWSWSYFRDRHDNRKRYLELAIRYRFGKRLTYGESEEIYAVKRTLYPADARYLVSLELRLAMERVHVLRDRICDNCRGALGRERVICMDCISPSSYFNSIDLCGDRECLTAEISRNDLDKLHLSSHRTFKSRKMLLLRDIGFAWSMARDAIARGDKAFAEALASYEAGSDPETTLKAQDDKNDENDGSVSKTHADCTEESGSPIQASHKKAQTTAEPLSPVTEASRRVDAMNPQSAESTSVSSASVSGTLEEPDSSGHAKGNTNKVGAQTASPQGKDVSSKPSEQSSGVASHQEGGGSTKENAVAPPAKLETNKNGETRAESKTTGPLSATQCYYCNQKLKSPCWYCIDCKDTTLICMFCDPPGGFDKGHHKKVHTLLSVRRTYEEEVSEEEKNRSLTMVKLSELETRLNSLENRFSEGFMRIENLLERLNIGQSGGDK